MNSAQLCITGCSENKKNCKRVWLILFTLFQSTTKRIERELSALGA